MPKKPLKITILSFFEKHSPTCENFTFAHIGLNPFMEKFHKELESLKRVTLEKGPMVKSFKLVSRPLDEGPRPRQIKL